MVDFKFALDISNLLGVLVFAILGLIAYEKCPTHYILSKIIKRKMLENCKLRDDEENKNPKMQSLEEITLNMT